MLWESVIEITTEKGHLRLHYFVTPLHASPALGAEVCGIGISDMRETKTVKDFSPDAEGTVALMQKLCRLQVTPATFFEILDDYLAE